jgi:FkbM family methyltransferase
MSWGDWYDVWRTFGTRNLPAFVHARLARRPVAFSTTVGATRLELRAGTSDTNVYDQVFTRQEYAFPCHREVLTIIDGGANIGLSSLFFADRFRRARILAVEPEVSNVAVLRRNTRHLDRIVPVHAAIGPVDGLVDVIDDGHGHWAFRTWSDPAGRRGRIVASVGAVNIPTLMRTYGIEFVDILKLDIEGAEKEVFENCADWIDRVGMVVVELHDRGRPGCTAAFQHATAGFDRHWVQGELTCAARGSLMAPTAVRRDAG